jgi:hypothetical protein
MNLTHRIINEKLLLSVTPRGGHHTLKALCVALQNEGIHALHIPHVPPCDNLQELVQPCVKKIKFVRNPFHRAVSSYMIVFGNPKIKLWRKFGIADGRQSKVSFREYIDLLKGFDLEQVNHHASRQIDHRESDWLEYDEVRKIENFDSEISSLLQAADVPEAIAEKIQIPDSGKNIKDKIDYNVKVFDWTLADMSKSSFWPTVPVYENFYDESLKAKVEQLYCTDLYDYEFTLEPS